MALVNLDNWGNHIKLEIIDGLYWHASLVSSHRTFARKFSPTYYYYKPKARHAGFFKDIHFAFNHASDGPRVFASYDTAARYNGNANAPRTNNTNHNSGRSRKFSLEPAASAVCKLHLGLVARTNIPSKRAIKLSPPNSPVSVNI